MNRFEQAVLLEEILKGRAGVPAEEYLAGLGVRHRDFCVL
jgi:hypothetical protein